MTPQEEAANSETSAARLWELAIERYDDSCVYLLLLSIKSGKKLNVIKVLKELSRASLYTVKKWTDDMPCFINRRGLRREDGERVKAAVLAEGGEIELRSKATPGAHAAIVAQNTTAPSELLWALGLCDDKELREVVIGHPLLPQPLLYFLGCEFPREFLQNPSVQLALLEDPQAFHQWPEPLKLAILTLPDMSEGVLRALLYKGSSAERKAALRHPALPYALLDELSRSGSIEQREEIADNPNTPIELLARLAQDPHVTVRTSVAINPNTPHHILRELRNVGGRIAENPSAPLDLLLELAKRGNVEILYKLQKRPNLTREELDALARHPEREINIIAATHQNTSPATLEALSHSEDMQTLSRISENPNTPHHVLARFAQSGEGWLLEGVASNPSTPPNLLSDIEPKLRGTTHYESVLLNPNLPEEICLQRIHAAPVSHRRQLAAITPKRALLEVLVRDENREVRAAVAQNPNTPAALLQRLREDPEPTIQQQAARREQTPIQWE